MVLLYCIILRISSCLGCNVFVEVDLGFDPALTLRALNVGWECLEHNVFVEIDRVTLRSTLFLFGFI